VPSRALCPWGRHQSRQRAHRPRCLEFRDFVVVVTTFSSPRVLETGVASRSARRQLLRRTQLSLRIHIFHLLKEYLLSSSNETPGRTNLGFAEYNIRITILRLVHIGRGDHKQELLEFHEVDMCVK
jgi:hypothetical protein